MAQRIGTKRTRDEGHEALSQNQPVTGCQSSQYVEICTLFRQYQQELDSSHDKKERLVKLSRDVTIQSKRIIFLLHRLLSVTDRGVILSEAEQKLHNVMNLLHKIAEELKTEDPARYKGAYSPGVQEFIEALSLYHYWKENSLLSYAAAQSYLTFERDVDQESVVLFLNPFDYLLGIADLSGELMRVAVNSVGLGHCDLPPVVVQFMRTLYCGYVALNHGSMNREFHSKLEMLLNNLVKVEQTCYKLKIRGSESPT
ncbi:translin-associated protein X-like [Dysidea avara]|uniref:translin-associated protein X-like n=1 Tax=Dysidea avara TaxID=196820 RepID=UPI00331FA9CE